MPETVIHNGQIIVDGKSQEQAPLPADPQRASELDPEEIAREMARTVSEGTAAKLLPMQIVNNLLTLRSPGGEKLVWTRFDLYQCFALWSKKMVGELKT